MDKAKSKLSQLVDAPSSGDAGEQPIFGALKGWDVDWEAFDQADGDIENQFEESPAPTH